MEKGPILYPCYFDTSLQRSQGRKVAQNTGIPAPALLDLERALKTSGIRYQIEKKSHPAWWWKNEGRIRVEYEGSKCDLLRTVVKALKPKSS